MTCVYVVVVKNSKNVVLKLSFFITISKHINRIVELNWAPLFD
jgi:hypothetical protein